MGIAVNSFRAKYNAIKRNDLNAEDKSKTVTDLSSNHFNCQSNKASTPKTLALLLRFKYFRTFSNKDSNQQEQALTKLNKHIKQANPEEQVALSELTDLLSLVKNSSSIFQRQLPQHFKELLTTFLKTGTHAAINEFLDQLSENDLEKHALIDFLEDNYVINSSQAKVLHVVVTAIGTIKINKGTDIEIHNTLKKSFEKLADTNKDGFLAELNQMELHLPLSTISIIKKMDNTELTAIYTHLKQYNPINELFEEAQQVFDDLDKFLIDVNQADQAAVDRLTVEINEYAASGQQGDQALNLSPQNLDSSAGVASGETYLSKEIRSKRSGMQGIEHAAQSTSNAVESKQKLNSLKANMEEHLQKRLKSTMEEHTVRLQKLQTACQKGITQQKDTLDLIKKNIKGELDTEKKALEKYQQHLKMYNENFAYIQAHDENGFCSEFIKYFQGFKARCDEASKYLQATTGQFEKYLNALDLKPEQIPEQNGALAAGSASVVSSLTYYSNENNQKNNKLKKYTATYAELIEKMKITNANGLPDYRELNKQISGLETNINKLQAEINLNNQIIDVLKKTYDEYMADYRTKVVSNMELLTATAPSYIQDGILQLEASVENIKTNIHYAAEYGALTKSQAHNSNTCLAMLRRLRHIVDNSYKLGQQLTTTFEKLSGIVGNANGPSSNVEIKNRLFAMRPFFLELLSLEHSDLSEGIQTLKHELKIADLKTLGKSQNFMMEIFGILNQQLNEDGTIADKDEFAKQLQKIGRLILAISAYSLIKKSDELVAASRLLGAGKGGEAVAMLNTAHQLREQAITFYKDSINTLNKKLVSTTISGFVTAKVQETMGTEKDEIRSGITLDSAIKFMLESLELGQKILENVNNPDSLQLNINRVVEDKKAEVNDDKATLNKAEKRNSIAKQDNDSLRAIYGSLVGTYHAISIKTKFFPESMSATYVESNMQRLDRETRYKSFTNG